MRIYQSCAEMHAEEKRNLHEMGTIVHPATMQDKAVADDPAYRTLELSPAVFTILDGSDRDAWLTSLGLNVEWARADFAERVTAGGYINPGEAYKLRGDVWGEFLHDGKFSYTYNERLHEYNVGAGYALPRLISELVVRPDTRQAVLPVFSVLRDYHNLGGAARVPCTMHYQFLIRRGQLNVFTIMRSCDFMTHFPYDVWMGLALQAYVADKVGARVGNYTFFAGSLHIYAKDADPGVF